MPAPAPDRLTRDASLDRRSGAGRFSLVRAFGCAVRGVGYTFASQRNLKIQSVFAVVAVALGIALRISQGEWLAVVLCIAVVCSLEAVNTAIESVVDLASPEWHELARNAKDAAAGAVLVASTASVIVALIVFAPRLLGLL